MKDIHPPRSKHSDEESINLGVGVSAQAAKGLRAKTDAGFVLL